MTQLDQLPPDQRAALSLLLRQGRHYEDVARLLHIEPETVRRRALAALAALGPRDTGAMPDERRDEIGDYLLGQQPASGREETREYLEEAPGGRAWARVVASELRPLAAGELPEIPGEGFERDPPSAPERDETRAAPAPAPRPPTVPRRAAAETPGALPPTRAAGEGRGRPGRSGPAGPAGFGRAGGPPASAAAHSRVGRAVLLMGLGVIVAALIILIVEGVIFGGGGSSTSDNATLASSASSAASTSTPTTTSTTSATSSSPRIVAQIPFAPTSHGGHAAAVANVAQSGNQKAFALVAQGLAPTKGFAYAVWLYNPGANAEPLGFINQRVGADGRVTAEGVLPGNETRFKQMVITQETASKPTRPGTIVLVGQLNP